MDIKDAHIRNFLRALAAIILVVYVGDIIFRKLKTGALYLDVNDGYVIGGCIAILLAIEAVRAYVKKKLDAQACEHDDNDDNLEKNGN